MKKTDRAIDKIDQMVARQNRRALPKNKEAARKVIEARDAAHRAARAADPTWLAAEQGLLDLQAKKIAELEAELRTERANNADN
jgi:hypothetical protein